MKLIDADDLYQKCIEIQLKKRNRYFDIDDVIKLIKKAPTVDILDKIRAEIDKEIDAYQDGGSGNELVIFGLIQAKAIIEEHTGIGEEYK